METIIVMKIIRTMEIANNNKSKQKGKSRINNYGIYH